MIYSTYMFSGVVGGFDVDQRVTTTISGDDLAFGGVHNCSA